MVWWWLQGKVSWWRLTLIVITHFLIHLPTDSLVTSVTTVTSPVTTAKKPLLVLNCVLYCVVYSLTVMMVPVTGSGVEPQETQEGHQELQ